MSELSVKQIAEQLAAAEAQAAAEAAAAAAAAAAEPEPANPIGSTVWADLSQEGRTKALTDKSRKQQEAELLRRKADAAAQRANRRGAPISAFDVQRKKKQDDLEAGISRFNENAKGK